jgi:hypothetical protein
VRAERTEKNTKVILNGSDALAVLRALVALWLMVVQPIAATLK